MFGDLVEEVSCFLEGKPRGEANPEGESEEQERKRRAREAFARKSGEKTAAKAKKTRSLRRQLGKSKTTARMTKARSTKALKTHANITEPPKAKPPKPLVTGREYPMFGDIVEEVRWLFEGGPSRRRKPERQAASGISSAERAATPIGMLPKRARGPHDKLAARAETILMKKAGAAKYRAMTNR